jgi:peptide/nickel transport system substrate-binding protein
MKAKYMLITALLLSLAICLAIWDTTTQPAHRAQGSVPDTPTRQGAWLDSIVFAEQKDLAQAITQLHDNGADLFSFPMSDPDLFQTVLEDPSLTHTEASGNYNELTFNPSGPTFNDGRLNPFSNAKIREAMNWLVDRNFIAQELFGGMASPKYLPIQTIGADYSRYQSTIEGIEAMYTYDLNQAQATIATEMQAMGASLESGTWHFNGQPVILIFIIRASDMRLYIGNYVSDQLERVGFQVDRQHKDYEEAIAIVEGSDPAQGLWQIYTAGWIDTWISRDNAANFGFFYTVRGRPSSPLWQAYNPTAQFDEICGRLWDNDFTTLGERAVLFEQALTMAMNDSGAGTQGAGSLHVFLVNQTSFTARRSGTTVANDRAGSVYTTEMFPYVARFDGIEGGTLRIIHPLIFYPPWNPIAGRNAVENSIAQRATGDRGLVVDPNTGLNWPLRIESAEVVVKAGLPITKTLDWVTLTTSSTISVPDDAWVDWDAINQVFITAGEKYSEPQTANSKVTVYYPADFFSIVTWHDGSPVSMGDIILDMIMKFDQAKVDSFIYDESVLPAYNDFMSHFKGVKIESTNPLVITTYDDRFHLDAELMVQTWFPARSGFLMLPAPWQTVTAALRAEAAGELAFSSAKATSLGIPWTDFVSGSSLTIMADWMNQSAIEHYIPYLPTMGMYVNQAEAEARWEALQTWYAARHHFWLGTGPFYLEQLSTDPNSITLNHFDAYPDAAGGWDEFAAPAAPEMVINHPVGAPGSYFNITGSGFPHDSQAILLSNNHIIGELQVDNSGKTSFTLSSDLVNPGDYHLRLSVNPSAGVLLTIDGSQPTWPREGTLPIVHMPATRYIHIPMVNKN